MTRNEQNRAVSSTGRTRTNTSEQGVSSPPFGSSEYLLRTPPYLKQGYKGLEVFSSFPLYSNAATALQPIVISGRRYLLSCRTATKRKLQRPHFYKRRIAATKDHPFSLDCSCDEERWRTPANLQVGFSLGHTEHFLLTLPELT